MSKVTSVDSDETHVLLMLACGHVQHWTASLTKTPQETAASLLEDETIVIGTTRQRCNEMHE